MEPLVNPVVFSLEAFNESFDKNLKALGKAEKLTRELVKDMSRDVLNALYVTEDSGKLNQFIAVLSPVNRKVAILFYREFSGFKWDEDEAMFGKKDKKGYDKAKGKGVRELEDPHFNLWTWSEKNIEMEVKPLDLAKITAYAKGALKKANDQGVPQSELIKAFFAAGFEPDALIEVMKQMTEVPE